MVTSLAQRAKELENKGIAVFLVHISDIPADGLREWIQENDIPFPSGCIVGDREKVLAHWGVRSRPWLILTDRDHVVTSEGFSIVELDERMARSAGN